MFRNSRSGNVKQSQTISSKQTRHTAAGPLPTERSHRVYDLPNSKTLSEIRSSCSEQMTIRQPRNYRFLSSRTLACSSNVSVLEQSGTQLTEAPRRGFGVTLNLPIVTPISSAAFFFLFGL
jgi:hypothetical protein